jgi:sensor histidine kinase YesM
MCVSLGLILETGLNHEIELIRLTQELELVEAYASIQFARFKRPCPILTEFSQELIHALVPKLSLQPLVENALLHAFPAEGQEERQDQVTIRAIIENNLLVLEVEDNGIGLAASAKRTRLNKRRKGIALINLKERLALMFKEKASLELLSTDVGTLARLKLPLLISAPYESKGGLQDVEGTARGG